LLPSNYFLSIIFRRFFKRESSPFSYKIHKYRIAIANIEI